MDQLKHFCSCYAYVMHPKPIQESRVCGHLVGLNEGVSSKYLVHQPFNLLILMSKGTKVIFYHELVMSKSQKPENCKLYVDSECPSLRALDIEWATFHAKCIFPHNLKIAKTGYNGPCH